MSFSFQFYIDMGDSKIGSLPITHLSDPYIEASKFCAKYDLDPIIITILGDEIREQMLREREAASNLCLQEIAILQSNTLETEGEIEARPFQDIIHKISRAKIPSKPTCASLACSSLATSDKNRKESMPTQSTQLHRQFIKYDPFLQLYNNSKQIQAKKEINRKKSYQMIPFKPEINPISKRIVEGKRINQKMRTVENQKKQSKLQRNNSKGKIIKYSVEQPSKGRPDKENEVHILPHSQQLAQKLRKDCLRDIFHELLPSNQRNLVYSDLDFESMQAKHKILMPIFTEMKMMDEQITQKEFVDAGMRLLDYLSFPQKSLLRANSKCKLSTRKDSLSKSKLTLRNSVEMRNGNDIYSRGQIYQKRSQQKKRRIKENIERRILAECSFKPKINLRMIA